MRKPVGRSFFKFALRIAVAAVLVFTILYFAPDHSADCLLAKPVIYLYPEKETQVSVTLDGVALGTTYPEYGNGWTVLAQPDGTLTDLSDGLEYSYLFWDGQSGITFDFSQGFCIAGKDTAGFLRDALTKTGLTPREYNEFIVYWLPLMEGNAYNLISFQGENYTQAAKLTVSPEPDSILRVFMAWKPVNQPVDIAPQTFGSFVRDGFTVVEWGGAQVD